MRITNHIQSHGTWLRDQLICSQCDSIPRERALAFVLTMMLPNWRNLAIHESSPADRGISLKLNNHYNSYFSSQYYYSTNKAMVRDVYNVSLEDKFLENEKFDVFIAIDAFEHVFEPRAAIQEIHRTLKPGGVALLTYPIIKSQVDALMFRAKFENGRISFLSPAEYHENPIDELGSLVTVDYGYEIHQKFSE